MKDDGLIVTANTHKFYSNKDYIHIQPANTPGKNRARKKSIDPKHHITSKLKANNNQSINNPMPFRLYDRQARMVSEPPTIKLSYVAQHTQTIWSFLSFPLFNFQRKYALLE